MPHIQLRFNPISQQSRSRSVVTIQINLNGHSVSTSRRLRLSIPQSSQPELSDRSRCSRHSASTVQPPNVEGDSPSEMRHHRTVTTENNDSQAALIPKPPGEPGRPHSGGYNLQEQLTGWTTGLYDEIKAFVQMQAAIHLNEDRSFSQQDANIMKAVCQETARGYPMLLGYQDIWPVSAMLKVHLKNTSNQARKRGRGVL